MSMRGFAVSDAMKHRDGISEMAPTDKEVDEQSGGQTGSGDSRSRPLRSTVDLALDQYFNDLNGTEPNDLYAMVLQEVEHPLLKKVLDYTRGNQSRAAKMLGMNRSTLRKKLRYHGLTD